MTEKQYHAELDEQASVTVDESGTVVIVLTGGAWAVLNAKQASMLLDFLHRHRDLLSQPGKEEGEAQS